MPPAELTSPPPPPPEAIVAERLKASPQLVNPAYSIAEGKDSDEIVPTLVFDDGRFTYFRFPGNREVPAVFHVQGDGSEAIANTRMEDDLLVVDRALEAADGDIVVAMVDNELTLKRLQKRNGQVRLLPPDKASRTLKVGEFTRARIVAAEGHDLIAQPV